MYSIYRYERLLCISAIGIESLAANKTQPLLCWLCFQKTMERASTVNIEIMLVISEQS